ncbi:ATP-binding cassette sub- D member 1 [Coemansia sp. RSA 1933]|nr:ATP-binding cassette sub- D member 1 [Coemansia sp. RSA 1933]
MGDDSSTAESKDGFLGIKVISSGSLLATQRQASNESGDGTSEDSSSSEQEGQRVECGDAIVFDNVSIENGMATASGRQKRRSEHFTALTMQIERGHHCIVVGGEAERRRAFKAVLLGSSAAHISKGALRSPRPHVGILSIDSRPYIKSGSSLWELLIFPHDKMQSVRRGISERHLVAILRFMDFEHLLAHVDDDWGKVVDWTKLLKKHELLAVSVCRIIYHAPAFALVDDNDGLALLEAGQIRQLFCAAKNHHVTLLVMADYDPFDAGRGPQRRGVSADEGAFMTCIGEFARALRLDGDGGAQAWSFCVFGYGSVERPAFDVTEERAYLWNSMYASLEESYVTRLQRRTSTLSQCSTTERHWLMTPDTPSASTVFSSDSIASRRRSHAMSPALTARSSVSDFSSATLRRTMSSDLVRSISMRNTIDGALSGFISPPPGLAPGSARSPSAFGAIEKKQPVSSTLSSSSVSEAAVDDSIAEEEPIDKQPVETAHTSSETTDEAAHTSSGVPVEPALPEATAEPKASDDVLLTTDNVSPAVEVADPSPDNANETSSDTTQQETEPLVATQEAEDTSRSAPEHPPSSAEAQEHNRNPYARSKRSYARPQRSQFGHPNGRQSPQRQHSSSGPSFIPPASSSSSSANSATGRPFSRNDKDSPSLNSSAAFQQKNQSPSRTYARASPRKTAASSSRIPRPPVSGSASSSRSIHSDGSSMSSASIPSSHQHSTYSPTSVDELADSLGNL